MPPSELQAEIMATLGYFDYFRYPLKEEQVFRYMPVKTSREALRDTLSELADSGKIMHQEGFYSMKDTRQRVKNRLEGEARLLLLQDRIRKTAARLSRFPFIKFVGLSGSLSKGFAPPNADIDLFIITQKNRLWICRSILHLMKKLSFLKGSQHWYCMNYFIDETALTIEEQNYFTAIELTSLKPLVNDGDTYASLIEANKEWVHKFLPNSRPDAQGILFPARPALWARLLTLSGSLWLNEMLMKITDRKWRRKWKRRQYPAEDYGLAFKTRIHVSKNHLHNYQKKVLEHMKKVYDKVSS